MLTTQKTPVEALRKGLGILELLAHGGRAGVGVRELAAQTLLQPTTIHNLLKTLRICGYARRLERGRYAAGWKLRSLARPTMIDLDAEGPVLALLEALAQQTGESVVLTTLTAGRRQVLARVEGQREVKVGLGDRSGGGVEPFWPRVTGRVLAAWCDGAELDAILAVEGLPGPQWQEASDREQLERLLRQVRGSGFAETVTEEVAALACPILADDLLYGAIGLYLPTYRFNPERREALIKSMHTCVESLARHWAATTPQAEEMSSEL